MQIEMKLLLSEGLRDFISFFSSCAKKKIIHKNLHWNCERAVFISICIPALLFFHSASNIKVEFSINFSALELKARLKREKWFKSIFQ